MAQQKVSDERLRELWLELGNTSEIARRIGYTRTGCHLALERIGVRRLPRNGRYFDVEAAEHRRAAAVVAEIS